MTLDNDVYFDSPSDLRTIVAAFERHSRAACLAFRVYHPETGRLHRRDWCHPRPPEQEQEEFPTYFITEGASAFRRQVFDKVDPYWEKLWIGHEGFDLALRVMDAGYQIWYIPEIKVWHMASLETRETWRPYYFNTRNLFYVVYRNYPWWSGLVHLLPRLAVLAFYSIRYGFPSRFLAGVWDGLLDASRHSKKAPADQSGGAATDLANAEGFTKLASEVHPALAKSRVVTFCSVRFRLGWILTATPA